MAKFIQFIKNRFKLLVIASAAILVVTIVLFIVIDNGVSTNNSIKQIKKQIADDGNKTWYFYPDYSKSVEMEVGIDKDTKHLYVATIYNKVFYEVDIEDKTISALSLSTLDSIELEATYLYRKGKGGSTLGDPKGKMIYGSVTKSAFTTETTSMNKVAKTFGDYVAFCMGANTKSILPLVFILLIVLSSVVLVGTIVVHFIKFKCLSQTEASDSNAEAKVENENSSQEEVKGEESIPEEQSE